MSSSRSNTKKSKYKVVANPLEDNWAPDNPQWWIIGFNPDFMVPDYRKLYMIGTIDFSGDNLSEMYCALKITYYGDYALDEYLKCGAVDEWAMLEFQTRHLYEGVRNDFFYQYRHNCSGFTARNAEGDLLLCHNLDNPPKLPGVTLAENAVTGKTIGLSNLLYYYRFETEWEKFDVLSVEKPINHARVLGTPYEIQDGGGGVCTRFCGAA